LVETGMPSFNTLMHNSHIIFLKCWNTCSLRNNIVSHLAALYCFWCLQLQLLIVLFLLSFICICMICVFLCVCVLLYVFMCFMCIWAKCLK